MTWNGKADSIARLVADVENAYVKSNPTADCTVIGVLHIINKLGVKNIQLADSLNKSLMDKDILYSYTAIQRAAEDYMHRLRSQREASGQSTPKSAVVQQDPPTEQSRSRSRRRSPTPARERQGRDGAQSGGQTGGQGKGGRRRRFSNTPGNWEPNKGRFHSSGRWRNHSQSPGPGKGCFQSAGRPPPGPLSGVTMASHNACYFCGQNGHSIQFCYQNPNNSCFKCGLHGHMA